MTVDDDNKYNNNIKDDMMIVLMMLIIMIMIMTLNINNNYDYNGNNDYDYSSNDTTYLMVFGGSSVTAGAYKRNHLTSLS